MDTLDIDAAGLLKLSDVGNPAYETLSKYPRTSIYEDMKAKDLLNKQVQSNEKKKQVLQIKAK